MAQILYTERDFEANRQFQLLSQKFFKDIRKQIAIKRLKANIINTFIKWFKFSFYRWFIQKLNIDSFYPN